MKIMMHGFTDQEWESYLEGQLTTEEQDCIEAHMLGCWSCWDRYDQMKLTTDQLHETGAAARHSLQPSEMQLQFAFRKVMKRLTTPADATNKQIQQRLERLEVVMAKMCGTRTAAQALQRAAKGSPAQSLELVTSDNWESFLANLTSLAIVMCGETGAHLVRRNGQF